MKAFAVSAIVVSALGLLFGMKKFFSSLPSPMDLIKHLPDPGDLHLNFKGGLMTQVCLFFLAFSIVVLRREILRGREKN